MGAKIWNPHPGNGNKCYLRVEFCFFLIILNSAPGKKIPQKPFWEFGLLLLKKKK